MASKPKTKPHHHPVVITANALLDGRVVWLGGGGEWTGGLAGAAVFEGEDQIAAGLAAAHCAERRQLVVGAYEVEIAPGPGGRTPVSQRERIRAVGPTVREDLARPTPFEG